MNNSAKCALSEVLWDLEGLGYSWKFLTNPTTLLMCSFKMDFKMLVKCFLRLMFGTFILGTDWTMISSNIFQTFVDS